MSTMSTNDDDHRALVRPQVAQQAEQQPRVVALADGIVLVLGAHAVSISFSRSWRRWRSA